MATIFGGGGGGLRQKATNCGYEFCAGLSKVNFTVASSMKSGYDFFRGGGLGCFWLRCGYDEVGEGGSMKFVGYVVFGQPLRCIPTYTRNKN